MGHSAVFLPNDKSSARDTALGYGRVLITGGSDGSDLLRTGRDLQVPKNESRRQLAS